MTNNLIGQVCVKITGRESGRHCVIVDALDDNFVTVDGNVKRRRCNIDHLEFLNKKVNIVKGASTEQVIEALKKINVEIMTRTKKEKAEKKEDKEEKKEEKSRKNKK